MSDQIKKLCTKCQTEKSLDEFSTDKRGKYGRRYCCKRCDVKSRSEYQRKNLPKVLEKNRLWRKKNAEHHEQWLKDYAPRRRELTKTRYHSDPEFRTERIESRKKYTSNPQNRAKINAAGRERTKKYRQDPTWRMIQNLRRRLGFVLKGQRKSDKTQNLVGCSWEQLRAHIEGQFKPGMSWDNYGKKGWHIDHIIPCDSFDLSKSEEQARCFHYSNLQPLWWYENLSKGKRVTF